MMIGVSVTCDVARQLLVPPGPVDPGSSTVHRARVPEAPVDEYCHPSFQKGEIRSPTRQPR